jgi:Ni/Fe-hydrogenase 1 B-type cytochrome subunit
MNGSEFKRVLVWSGWLRLSHWSIAAAVLAAGLTGWQLGEGVPASATLVDFHYYAASLLVFGLALRLALMFVGREHERLGGLLPNAGEWRAAGAVLRFYLSAGKAPLPRWYAHNPLWKPLYLLVYVVLALQVATGSLMQDYPIILRFYLPSVHAFWAQVLLWFSVLHVAGVALHDLKGKTADVSAMINGYRLFFIDRSQLPGVDEQPLRFVAPGGKDKPG